MNSKIVKLLGLGAVVGLIVAATKKAEGQAEGDNNLSITIIPAHAVGRSIGRSIGAVAPPSGGTSIVEGSVGNKAVVVVTNNTVYSGTTTPAPYVFTLNLVIGAGSLVLDVHQPLSMTPGETKTLTFTFNIPYGSTPNYAATAWLGKTDNSAQIGGQATATGAIASASVTPGGSISF